MECRFSILCFPFLHWFFVGACAVKKSPFPAKFCGKGHDHTSRGTTQSSAFAKVANTLIVMLITAINPLPITCRKDFHRHRSGVSVPWQEIFRAFSHRPKALLCWKTSRRNISVTAFFEYCENLTVILYHRKIKLSRKNCVFIRVLRLPWRL